MVIGAGSIGGEVIKEADSIGRIEDIYIFDHHEDRAEEVAEKQEKASVVKSLGVGLQKADLVFEAASQEAVEDYGIDALESGTDLVIMSVGALADEGLREVMFKTAEEYDVNIYLPTGALTGIDAVRSASMVGVDEVVLETRKPPKSLIGAKFVEENDFDLMSLKEEEVIYEGKASQAVKLFPKNVNVAAALSLAGVGFRRTKVRIICDPDTDRNAHRIELKGEAGEIEGKSMNVPFPENPRTSYLAALSAVSALRKICSNVWSGM